MRKSSAAIAMLVPDLMTGSSCDASGRWLDGHLAANRKTRDVRRALAIDRERHEAVAVVHRDELVRLSVRLGGDPAHCSGLISPRHLHRVAERNAARGEHVDVDVELHIAEAVDPQDLAV